MPVEWIILISVVGGCFILAFFLCGLFVLKPRFKKKKLTIDETFMTRLIACLGGRENIQSATVDHGRLKFKVTDLEKVSFQEAKALSENGICVTGNDIKMIFKYQAEEVLRWFKN